MAEEKKKNIFDRAVDALTNRDEKAAAEKAAAEAAEAKALLEKAQAEAAKAKAEAEAAKKAALDAAKKAEEDRARQGMLLQQQRLAEQKAAAEKAAAEKAAAEAAAAAAAAAVIKHVWTKDDTYASLALKHYGKFTEPYWRLIYDHNKAIIGNHPNDIRVGLEIEIPPLPEELK